MSPLEHDKRSGSRSGYWLRLGSAGRLAGALYLCLGLQVSASCEANSPPDKLIDDLRREAVLIARVNIQDSSVTERSGNYLSYLVRARISRLYRGGKPRGSVVNYHARAEQGTENFGSIDRIVFLKRGTTSLSQWHALEFGQFRYDKALERRIQQRLIRYQQRIARSKQAFRNLSASAHHQRSD